MHSSVISYGCEDALVRFSLSGSKAVLLKGTKPEYILDAVSKEKCTIVWLLVPWAQDILEALDSGRVKLEDYDLSHWRLMHIGAQPVPPSLIKHWKRYFPNHQYDTNYGLSESIGPGCVHLGVENIDKVGAIGKPGFGWKVKIVDEKRNEVPQGEVGELAVKGPSVMTCYYNDEEATKEVMDDEGWLYTGDMAQMDEDGFIFLVDRKRMSLSVVVRTFIRYRSRISCATLMQSMMWQSLVFRISVWERQPLP